MIDEWWVMSDEWWVMSDEWWVMSDEWWVMSDDDDDDGNYDDDGDGNYDDDGDGNYDDDDDDGWLVDWLIACLLDWLVGWLVGWLSDWWSWRRWSWSWYIMMLKLKLKLKLKLVIFLFQVVFSVARSDCKIVLTFVAGKLYSQMNAELCPDINYHSSSWVFIDVSVKRQICHVFIAKQSMTPQPQWIYHMFFHGQSWILCKKHVGYSTGTLHLQPKAVALLPATFFSQNWTASRERSHRGLLLGRSHHTATAVRSYIPSSGFLQPWLYHVIPICDLNPQAMKPAMKFGTLNAVSHIHDPLGI